MAGPGHKAEWKRVRELVKTSVPTRVDRILGVNVSTRRVDVHKTEVTMDMQSYTLQAIDMYRSVKDAPALSTRARAPYYEPSIQEIKDLGSNTSNTIFGNHAASLLMKALYLARMVRMDLCFTINSLAKYVSKWNQLCDKQLAHLFSFMLNTASTKMVSIIDSRDLDNLHLEAYPDADLCGAIDSTKSTSGGILCLTGSHGTFVQLEWFSKRQAATSHSTSEAEMAALSKMLRECLIPQQSLWSEMLARDVKATVYEDNTATIKIAQTGYSQALRHMQKHHRINLGLVHDILTHPDLSIEHIPTHLQKGDLFTKGLNASKHAEAMKMVNLLGGTCVWIRMRKAWQSRMRGAVK
jgi:hypothetical protein